MKKIPQWRQVLSALEGLGGIATLSQLNHVLLISPDGAGRNWGTKTPDATIRRIVRQQSEYFHTLKPGLYCVRELAERYEREYNLPQPGESPEDVRERDHSYYQGLLVEIGKVRKYKTYVPAQDKNKPFVNQRLGDVCHITELPKFGYEKFLRHARTVDVIWFNQRWMPEEMFEVEMTTDMLNSLHKFNELRDFYAKLRIVAPQYRESHFEARMAQDSFYEIRRRVEFLDVDALGKRCVQGWRYAPHQQ